MDQQSHSLLSKSISESKLFLKRVFPTDLFGENRKCQTAPDRHPSFEKKIKTLYERRKFNILMLTDQLRNDQWDARFVDICTVLCREGHNVSVLATKVAYEQCLELKYMCRCLRQIGGWIPTHVCGVLRRILHAVRNWYVVLWACCFMKPKPELLFTHCIHLSALKFFHVFNRKCRIIMLFQVFNADQIPKMLREYRIKPSHQTTRYGCIDEVLCSSLLSTYIFTYTQRPENGPHTIEILYPTVRQLPLPLLGAPLTLPTGSLTFVAINNFTPSSNFTIAMKAFALLYGSLEQTFRNRIYLLIAGHRSKERKDKLYLRMLRNFITATNMHSKIFILCNIPRLLEKALIGGCYAYLHVQLQAVSQDNIIEAMSTGKPIVATNSGFPCEVLKHRETGYLLPLSAEDFADAMEELVLYPDRYKRMCSFISDTYDENFSYNEFVKHVNNIVSKYDDKRLVSIGREGDDNQNVIDLNNALEIIHRNNMNLPLINALASHQELISDRYYNEHRLYSDVPLITTE